jgi:hypothetical protein
VEQSVSAATVVVAMAGKSEVRQATKEGDAWKLAAPEPLCKELVECLKGADLTYCPVYAATCAWKEDRSAVVARLEYEGRNVDMRALDESAMYGVDARGAFAMRSATGDVLFVPGAERPSWPPTIKMSQPSGVVLKAAYDEAKRTWRVGSVASVSATPGSLTWLWILLGVLGALVILLFGATIVWLRSKRRTLKKVPS